MNYGSLKKSAIYTNYEKELLTALIKDKINTIECKETNKITNVKKTQAWEEIAFLFNEDL